MGFTAWRAVAFMLVSVVAYSVLPVFGALSVADLHPALFSGKGFFFAAFPSLALALALRVLPAARRLRTPSGAFDRPARAVGFIALSGAISVMSWIALFYSFAAINKASASILYETWLIYMTFMLPIFFPARYNALKSADLVNILIAFFGIYLIVTSGANDGTALADVTALIQLSEAQGYFLAFLSGVLMAVGTTVKANVMKRVESGSQHLSTYIAAEFFHKLAGGLTGLGVCALLAPEAFANLFDFDVALGFSLVLAVGAPAYWLSVTATRLSSVHLLSYFTPVIAAFWLYVFGFATINAAIAFGAAFIIVANILAHFRSDLSVAFPATVVAIVVSSYFSYHYVGAVSDFYYDAIAVPAGVFAIFVAFMMDRMAKRHQEQQETAFVVLEAAAKDASSERARALARGVLDVFAARNYSATLDRLDALETLAERESGTLPVSVRQFVAAFERRFGVGEVMVLWILGALTIVVAHLQKPDTISGDLLPTVLTASIVFLCVSALDQRNSRSFMILARRFDGIFGFEDVDPRDIERRSISGVILISAIFAGYSLLVLGKHAVIDLDARAHIVNLIDWMGSLYARMRALIGG